jgi:holliday junction DNA helicase RuvA
MCRCVNDSFIGLMGYQEGNIIACKLVSFQKFFTHIRHAGNSKFKNGLAFLVDIMLFPGNRFNARRTQGSAGLHMEMGFSAAVTSQDAVFHPVSLKIGFKQNGPGSVAENNAGAPVAVIHDGTHFIGTYHHHFLIPAAFHQGSPGRQAIEKSAAGCQQVKTPGIDGPDFLTNQVGSGREEHIRRNRSNDNTVNFRRVDTSFFTKLENGRHAEVGSGFICSFQDSSFGNTRPGADPFIIRIDHFLEVTVGEDIFRHIAAYCSDSGSDLLGHSTKIVGFYKIFTRFKNTIFAGMITFLRGDFVYKTPALIHIDVQGVGYEVQISLHTFSQLQHLDRGLVHIYHQVKEDDELLYGFFETGEKEMFIQLLSVSGVGASTARMMLSAMKPEELARAIVQGQTKQLESIKGIGKKSAERIVLELRDKVGKKFAGSNISPLINNTLEQDALNALVSLGIARPVAEQALKKLAQDAPVPQKVEDIIKQVLKIL